MIAPIVEQQLNAAEALKHDREYEEFMRAAAAAGAEGGKLYKSFMRQRDAVSKILPGATDEQMAWYSARLKRLEEDAAEKAQEALTLDKIAWEARGRAKMIREKGSTTKRSRDTADFIAGKRLLRPKHTILKNRKYSLRWRAISRK